MNETTIPIATPMQIIMLAFGLGFLAVLVWIGLQVYEDKIETQDMASKDAKVQPNRNGKFWIVVVFIISMVVLLRAIYDTFGWDVTGLSKATPDQVMEVFKNFITNLMVLGAIGLIVITLRPMFVENEPEKAGEPDKTAK